MSFPTGLALLLAFWTVLVAAAPNAPAGIWDSFNYAPSVRTVYPKSVKSVSGQVADPGSLADQSRKPATFSSLGAFVVLDFGKEVGGIISLNIDTATALSSFSLSFTESPLFINPTQSDGSRVPTPTKDSDGVDAVPAPLSIGSFTQPSSFLRGGFRYLTIASTSADPLSISDVRLKVNFMPHWDENLSAYSGYFHTQDPVSVADADFLNRVWYAGAYTIQTSTIPSDTAKQIKLEKGWANDASAGATGSSPVVVDGAKRDRIVTPASLPFASLTQLVSTYDLLSTRNALQVLFAARDPTTGSLPASGPPANLSGSFTYICWTLISLHTYWLSTNDEAFVRSVWPNYTKAITFLETFSDSTSLVNIPTQWAGDWGRTGGAGRNAAANALYYQVLITGSQLASTIFSDTALSTTYTTRATLLKSAFNSRLWNDNASLYRDNDVTTTIHPQDGNSLAVVYNLTTSNSQNKRISTALMGGWTSLGAKTPELVDTISPFVSGFEVKAHFTAGNGARALDLVRRTWGYMLNTNTSVQSTFLEGFTTNGSLFYRSTTGYLSDPTYPSHSSSWSTSPTSSFSQHILGIQLLSPLGKTFVFAPILSGLKTAKGGFHTEAGWFSMEWNLTASGVWTVETVVPIGCTGRLVTPTSTNFVRRQGGGDLEVGVEVKPGTQRFVFEGVSAEDPE